MSEAMVVLCTKVPADLARRFDEKAVPSRNVVLRRLIEGYVNEALIAEALTSPPTCAHPQPWVELATGAFCPQCRTKMQEATNHP